MAVGGSGLLPRKATLEAPILPANRGRYRLPRSRTRVSTPLSERNTTVPLQTLHRADGDACIPPLSADRPNSVPGHLCIDRPTSVAMHAFPSGSTAAAPRGRTPIRFARRDTDRHCRALPLANATARREVAGRIAGIVRTALTQPARWANSIASSRRGPTASSTNEHGPPR